MTSADLYLRLSDFRDDDEGFSGRERKLRQRAAELGWTVGRLVVENDLMPNRNGRARPASAFKRKRIKTPGGKVEWRVIRPGFRSILDDLITGRAQALLAEDLDRVARDPRDLEDLIDAAATSGASARSLSGSLTLTDGGTDAEITMARIMVAVANKSSRDTSRRVAGRREEKAAQGRYGGGTRPFGYERDGTTVRAAEAAEVQRWADRLLAGDSLRGIVADLRDRDVPTVTGAAWSTGTVRDVLLRARNAGIAVHRGREVGKAQWPAILAEDTWRATVALLHSEDRRTSPGNAPRWLGSLIYQCGVCDDGGAVYVGGGRPEQPTYVCRKRNHLRRAARPVDDMVTALVVGRLSKPDAAALLAPGPKVDTGALAREANTLRARIEEAADLWESGALPAAQVRVRTTRLRDRLAAVEAELSSTAGSDPLAGVAGRRDAAEVWGRLPLSQQRAIVHTLMTVTLLKQARPGRQPDGSYFDPASVHIEWRR
jgi:site-specific DNA recombinase